MRHLASQSPPRRLILLPMVALASCATTSSGHLSQSVTLDDQMATSVELAYQAASLAERTAVTAHLVTPAQAQELIVLDNQAYLAVCASRTAYDVANGNDPTKRGDQCPMSSKTGKTVSYVEAVSEAVSVVNSLLSTTKAMEGVN